MKKLTGLDASFLSMEGPTHVGHVAGLAIYSDRVPTSIPTPRCSSASAP